MRIDKERMAFRAAAIAVTGVVAMGAARVIGPRLGRFDDLAYLIAFLTTVGGALGFMWFWAERKGYPGTVGIGLALFGPLGALVLLALKDKIPWQGAAGAGAARIWVRAALALVIVLMSLSALGAIAQRATADSWNAERREGMKGACLREVQPEEGKGKDLPEGFALGYCTCAVARIEKEFPAYRSAVRAFEDDSSTDPVAQRGQKVFTACAEAAMIGQGQ